MFVLRTATEADAPALLEIYAPHVRESAVSFETEVPTAEVFAARISKSVQAWAWIVAEREGKPVGYAYGSAHRERAAYRWTVETSAYISPSAQGMGLGKTLYLELFGQLASRGYCNAMAIVALPNPASVKLHLAVGFEPVGVVKRAGRKFGTWHDVGWFQRQLREAPPDGQTSSAA